MVKELYGINYKFINFNLFKIQNKNLTIYYNINGFKRDF